MLWLSQHQPAPPVPVHTSVRGAAQAGWTARGMEEELYQYYAQGQRGDSITFHTNIASSSKPLHVCQTPALNPSLEQRCSIKSSPIPGSAPHGGNAALLSPTLSPCGCLPGCSEAPPHSLLHGQGALSRPELGLAAAKATHTQAD